MPKIHVEEVLTFSTEDPHHPASNILNSDPARKWKCAHTGERTASVVLQLEKAMQITGIDIGNENSAYIEVLVARSSTEYRPLLGMSSFMTPIEARNHTNINKVRMFQSKDFSQPECNEKWDRVKFVCVQPYNKHVQYGLSFVTLHTNEGSVAGGKKNVNRFTLRPDSPTAFSVGKLFSQEKESMAVDAIPSTSLKGAAAIREASAKPSQPSYKSPIIKRGQTACPKPSTSKESPDSDASIEKTGRNRYHNTLLYDEDDEAQNDKIDRLIEKTKQANVEKQKLKEKEDQKKGAALNKTPAPSKIPKNTNLRTGDTSGEAKKRKTDTHPSSLGSESPKSPKKRRTNDVLRESNASPTLSPKPGPSAHSSRQKRKSSEVEEKLAKNANEENDDVSPRKRARRTNVAEKKQAMKPYERLLEGVVIVISGIQNPERANLRTSALAMGAKYKADWDSSCTHLICAFTNTPKFNQVRGKGKIVKKQWITECQNQRKRLPWRRFCMDRKDMTGYESEDEIWEAVDGMSDSNEQNYSRDNDVDEDTDEEVERIQRNQQQKQKQEKSPKANEEQKSQTDIEEPKEDNNFDIAMNGYGEGKWTNGNLPALPNYFTGLKFYLSESLGAMKKDLTKYIVGYNGKIMEDKEDIDNNVLAITYSDDAEEIQELRKQTDRIISPLWLLECHNKKRLLPFDDLLL